MLASLERAPARGGTTTIRNFIGGHFVDGGRPFDIVNPATGQVHATAYEADRAMVDRAVDAARKAAAGDWGRMPLAQRRALLVRIADRIEERFDDFLEAEIADTGKPYQLTHHLDIPRGAANFRVFASLSTETF